MAKKRANGEGSLYRRADGTWICQIMIGYKSDGRRIIRTFTGKTRKEAMDKRDAFLRNRANGLQVCTDAYFDDFADAWYRHHAENVSPATRESYKYTLRTLKDHFGHRKLSDIRVIDIEEFLMKLRKMGMSDSHMAKCRGMLFQIFNWAVANDLILKNPVQYAQKMRKQPKQSKDTFTEEEVRALLHGLPDDKIGWSIRLLLCTGMRTQELLGLEPRHISSDGSRIIIEQAVVRVKGSVEIGTPKSQESYRTIPVPEFAQYYARRLRDTPNKYVWTSPKNPGMPCNPSHFANLFCRAVGSVEGVRLLTPHCCRHTYVSQLQALGIPVETIRGIVGHADISMTRHYLHIREDTLRNAVDRFSKLFSASDNDAHEKELHNKNHPDSSRNQDDTGVWVLEEAP